jgi:hypothetical protein
MRRGEIEKSGYLVERQRQFRLAADIVTAARKTVQLSLHRGLLFAWNGPETRRS